MRVRSRDVVHRADLHRLPEHLTAVSGVNLLPNFRVPNLTEAFKPLFVGSESVQVTSNLIHLGSDPHLDGLPLLGDEEQLKEGLLRAEFGRQHGQALRNQYKLMAMAGLAAMFRLTREDLTIRTPRDQRKLGRTILDVAHTLTSLSTGSDPYYANRSGHDPAIWIPEHAEHYVAVAPYVNRNTNRRVNGYLSSRPSATKSLSRAVAQL